MDKVTSRCEEFLCSQASSVKNYIIAQQYNLPELLESNLSYLKRAPVSRWARTHTWSHARTLARTQTFVGTEARTRVQTRTRTLAHTRVRTHTKK